MKKALMLVLSTLILFATASDAREVKVKSYTKKDGTKVSGYTKTVKEYDTVKVSGYTKKDGTKVKSHTRKRSTK